MEIEEETDLSGIEGLYTVVIQTDPTKTINEGFKTLIEQQTFEHIAGIVCLGYCLFGPQINKHLRVYIHDTRSGGGNWSDSESAQKQLNPADIVDEYFICLAPLFIEYANRLEWFEYIQILASSSKVHRLPNPIVKRFTCRFKTPITTTIVQFNLTSFLEGAIKLCGWLDYAYTDFIDLVHLGDAKLTVVPS